VIMLPSHARIFVATQPVDFRGSFDRFAGFVREQLGSDPRSGDLYIFLNRGGDKLKIVFFDKTGDCILYKRLDDRSFHGAISVDPSTQKVEIETGQLMALLQGIEMPSKSRH
jgi:transposase